MYWQIVYCKLEKKHDNCVNYISLGFTKNIVRKLGVPTHCIRHDRSLFQNIERFYRCAVCFKIIIQLQQSQVFYILFKYMAQLRKYSLRMSIPFRFFIIFYYFILLEMHTVHIIFSTLSTILWKQILFDPNVQILVSKN